MNIALIIAGGMGSRMGNYIPKQFLNVYDKPIIIYTLELFQANEDIDAIIISVLEKWEEVVWAYAKQYNITKLKWVVTGGDSNQSSIWKGLEELQKHCSLDDTVMVHAANRPLITNEMISDNLNKFREYGDAVAATPCVEVTLKSEDGLVASEYIPREKLYRTQTPQTYSLEKLLWAHERARKENIVAGSSAALMFALEEKVHFSKGSPDNIKITTEEDLQVVKALLKERMDK